MNKVIACIGNGFVGGSLTTVFAERGFDVYAYDKSGKYATGAKIVKDADNLNDFILSIEKDREFSRVYFVCLPNISHILQHFSFSFLILENFF